jgi:DNA-binding XRE family transcriptional regulator
MPGHPGAAEAVAPQDTDEHQGTDGRGRPSKYSPAIAKQIIRYITLGMSKDSAAEAAGIAPSTLYKWQAERPRFSERVARARVRLKTTLLEQVEAGCAADPRLSLEFLARLWPAEFGRRQTVAIEGGDPEKPVNVNLSYDEEKAEIARKLAGMSTEQLREMAAALRKKSIE